MPLLNIRIIHTFVIIAHVGIRLITNLEKYDNFWWT